MSPLADSNGCDAPRMIGACIPCATPMAENIVVGFEYSVREPVIAHEPPQLLDGVDWAQRGGNGMSVVCTVSRPTRRDKVNRGKVKRKPKDGQIARDTGDGGFIS